MDQPVCGTGDNRQAHHARALQQFRNLNQQIKRLENLVDTIRGEDTPKEAVQDKKPEPVIPLELFLKQTPDEVAVITDRIVSIIDRLQSALF